MGGFICGAERNADRNSMQGAQANDRDLSNKSGLLNKIRTSDLTHHDPFRASAIRSQIRDSVRTDPLIRASIIDQLINYKQAHLVAHHRFIQQNPDQQKALIEDLSYIDYATVDFVKVVLPSSITTLLRTGFCRMLSLRRIFGKNSSRIFGLR